MAKFRKKPIVIDAEQYQPGANIDGIKFCSCAALNDALGDHQPSYYGCSLCGSPYIQTLEGAMKVSPGDWIITGVKGEKDPCKPDVFAATYEPAE